ncbi:uncharacterized protein LOC131934941 [Physella acuta]|uniref:uncharacterized protein LOC131934941 n=1 Tax=Physella acuta TaxID=109671 RepID=UPI0027DB89EC|nr:uncharacterized protein LOC131934941 [Physella acuta]
MVSFNKCRISQICRTSTIVNREKLFLLFCLTVTFLWTLPYLYFSLPRIVSRRYRPVPFSPPVSTQPACMFPDLDPYDPSVIDVFRKTPAFRCKGEIPYFTTVGNGIVMVNFSKVAMVTQNISNFKHCRYYTRARDPTGPDDRAIQTIRVSPFFRNSINLTGDEDYISVDCFNMRDVIISRSFHQILRIKPQLEAELDANLKRHKKQNAPKEIMSVIIFGIDGVSKQNFHRSMPKTRDFLLHTMKAIELLKFNKIGVNTLPNIFPLLTGKLLSDVDSSWNWTLGDNFDAINDLFLWSQFRKAGYRSSLILDLANNSAFHYYKKGWKKAPVDYYPRELILDTETYRKDKFMLCMGDEPEVSVLMEHVLQLAAMFNESTKTPYFVFRFAAMLTHDNPNHVSAGDELYLDFLKNLAKQNLLHNTLFLFMSDHGARFGDIRSTFNGMLEERMPMFYLVFPGWFQTKYPKLMKVVKMNRKRLTTFLDIHATLKDILYFNATTGRGDLTQSGISLFKNIPKERLCHHALVADDICACNRNITMVDISEKEVSELSQALVSEIRFYTRLERDRCAPLELKSSGRIAMLPVVQHMTERYIMTVVTQPGDGVYQGVVERSPAKEGNALVGNATGAGVNSPWVYRVLGSVLRLNLYRGQAECVESVYLMPFCFCLRPPSP